MLGGLGILGTIIILVLGIGFLVWVIRCYRKVERGTALIKTGLGGVKVSFSGAIVVPIIHRADIMDISVKRIAIERLGEDGLICQDNMRADIKVAFFVRVNPTKEDVNKVAEMVGVKRASDLKAMVDLFDAKFSEALKTVGKQFNFVDLYNTRAQFKEEILQVIGTDLNGYVLDDCAIDYLEQTDITYLKADNILDAEGIKKITDLTAKQKILANQIDRDREKTIKAQDVEAAEAVLELDRQLAESTEKQRREIAAIKARETAEAMKVQQEEKLKAESARIVTEEELQVAEENKQRQVLVASKNKERTAAVETERVEKDRQLEVIERERVVALTSIEKERAVEVERKNIQEVIRERVAVEKGVVQEEERIKDTRAFAEADRTKQVAITHANMEAEETLVRQVKAAQALKDAAQFEAEQKIIEADASQKASDKQAEARKVLAEAKAAEDAAVGMAEAQVQEAKAHALEMEGMAQASVIEKKAMAAARGKEANAAALLKEGNAQAAVLENTAVAEARGEEAKAAALIKTGEAEAENLLKKFQADAQGIRDKGDAMKLFDGPGRDHEEFKIRLAKEKDVELAALHTQEEIARAQAEVIQEGLRVAKIEIVGGESMFFDKISNSIAQGRSVDRLLDNSKALKDIKNTFFGGDAETFKHELHKLIDTFGISSEDVKNLSLAALIGKLMQKADGTQKGILERALQWVEKHGLGNASTDILG